MAISTEDYVAILARNGDGWLVKRNDTTTFFS